MQTNVFINYARCLFDRSPAFSLCLRTEPKSSRSYFNKVSTKHGLLVITETNKFVPGYLFFQLSYVTWIHPLIFIFPELNQTLAQSDVRTLLRLMSVNKSTQSFLRNLNSLTILEKKAAGRFKTQFTYLITASVFPLVRDFCLI